MYLFKTSTVIESLVCPGVSFTVRKMTEDRRDSLRLQLAVPLGKMEMLGEELRTLQGRTDAESNARRGALLAQSSEIENGELASIKIKWGLLAIKGLCIDTEENVATVDEWKKWPSDLVMEAIHIINSSTGLSTEEIKNSELPSTPSSSESVATNDLTAPSASASDSTKPETADPSTQQT